MERGLGYTFAVLNVESSTGSGANLSVSFSTGDLDTSQSQVELSAINGALENYKVINGGSGYASNVVVTVTGDGTGANVTAILSASNTITGLTINESGTCLLYTSPSPRDSDSSRMPSSA